MTTWILLLSVLLPQPRVTAQDGMSALDAAPLRYRGIEQLLAKFDAAYEAEVVRQNR
jgi:hypothetical protein